MSLKHSLPQPSFANRLRVLADASRLAVLEILMDCCQPSRYFALVPHSLR